MEFEDMQVIWNSQNQERLFAIDEEALYAYIKRKGRSTNHLLQNFEAIMILGNLFVGILLVTEGFRDHDQLYKYILPIMFLLFSAVALIRRFWRHQEEVHFEQTMVGELDKAIWRINYLIRQGRSMMLWYALPVILALSILMVLDSKPIWAWFFLLILGLLAYFAGRWEINKCYVPKKRRLESLREKLLQEQTDIA